MRVVATVLDSSGTEMEKQMRCMKFLWHSSRFLDVYVVCIPVMLTLIHNRPFKA